MIFHPPRKVDLGLYLTVLTIAGILWKAYAFPSAWTQASKDICDLKPVVAEQGKKIVAIETTLADMQEDVKYIRRHTRP